MQRAPRVQPMVTKLRLRSMRTLPAMAFVLAAATGCGASAGAGGGHQCTAIGSPAGISVDVAADMATKTSGDGKLRVCWDGVCHTREVSLRASTKPTNETCGPEVCSSQLTRTGREHAFASVPKLPAAPVRATLTLSGSGGAPLVRETLRVTPEKTYPNGPDCGAGGPQASLVVGPSGKVRAR